MEKSRFDWVFLNVGLPKYQLLNFTVSNLEAFESKDFIKITEVFTKKESIDETTKLYDVNNTDSDTPMSVTGNNMGPTEIASFKLDTQEGTEEAQLIPTMIPDL